MTDEVKHTPKRVGVSGDLFARTAAERDRLHEVNADLLAALERIAREGAYEPTDAELSGREDAGHWLQILGRWDAGEVALAAIARARGENVNA